MEENDATEMTADGAARKAALAASLAPPVVSGSVALDLIPEDATLDAAKKEKKKLKKKDKKAMAALTVALDAPTDEVDADFCAQVKDALQFLVKGTADEVFAVMAVQRAADILTFRSNHSDATDVSVDLSTLYTAVAKYGYNYDIVLSFLESVTAYSITVPQIDGGLEMLERFDPIDKVLFIAEPHIEDAKLAFTAVKCLLKVTELSSTIANNVARGKIPPRLAQLLSLHSVNHSVCDCVSRLLCAVSQSIEVQKAFTKPLTDENGEVGPIITTLCKSVQTHVARDKQVLSMLKAITSLTTKNEVGQTTLLLPENIDRLCDVMEAHGQHAKICKELKRILEKATLGAVASAESAEAQATLERLLDLEEKSDSDNIRHIIGFLIGRFSA